MDDKTKKAYKDMMERRLMFKVNLYNNRVKRFNNTYCPLSYSVDDLNDLRLEKEKISILIKKELTSVDPNDLLEDVSF